MKGKLLTLNEVAQLEDKAVVWIDYNNEQAESTYGYNGCHCMAFRSFEYGGFMMCEYPDNFANGFDIETNPDMEVYEWIDVIDVDKTFYETVKLHKLTINLLTEICKTRGIDPIDDNLCKLIEEFAN